MKNNNKLFDGIVQIMLKKFPTLQSKLINKKNRLDRYHEQLFVDIDGETWFLENSIHLTGASSKWEINDKLTFIYGILGEKLFEDFVEYYWGLNIREKNNNNKENWLFY